MPIRLLQDSSAATWVSLLRVGQEFDSWHRHFYGITAFLILDWLGGPGTRNSPRLLNLVLEHLGWIILWGSAGEGGGLVHTVGCRAASLTSTHWMPLAPILSAVTTKSVSRRCYLSPGGDMAPVEPLK